MLFLTNREVNEGLKTEIGRKVTFKLDNNAPTNNIYFCLRTGHEHYQEIGLDAFMHTIRESPYKEILLFIHGFNSLPENNIFPHAQLLQSFFNQLEENLVKVVPLVWPCDSECGIVRDYWDDQQCADMSAFAFARALAKFVQWQQASQPNTCLKRVNVLAHSMGNRVLEGTLRAWNKYHLAHGVPRMFRNTFMIAADLPNDALDREQPGALISHASRNVCVYFAADDWGLRASKLMHTHHMIMSRRLGHTGPDDIIKAPHNVYALDCDEFNDTYDPPVGHTYFLGQSSLNPGIPIHPGLLVDHMYQTMKTGRVFPGDPLRRWGILDSAMLGLGKNVGG